MAFLFFSQFLEILYNVLNKDYEEHKLCKAFELDITTIQKSVFLLPWEFIFIGCGPFKFDV